MTLLAMKFSLKAPNSFDGRVVCKLWPVKKLSPISDCVWMFLMTLRFKPAHSDTYYKNLFKV